MKKRLYLLFTILSAGAVLTLSSCLKDSRYVDFSKVGTNVNFPLGGLANFGGDAITATPDTDANGTIVKQFAVNVASPNVPTTPTTLTLAVDNSIVGTYPTTPVAYDVMPEDAYSFTATSVTIPAGQQYATVSITFFKNKLDPSKSYMLPVKIAKTTNGIISANYSIHYFHFIGNDFAGAYTWDYYRYNDDHVLPTPSGGTAIGQDGVINPVTPTEFQMITGYNSQGVRYDVKFNRNVSGSTVTYSDFSVVLLPADVTGIWAPAGITITQPAKFYSITTADHAPPFDPAGPLTYAQAIQMFTFQYIDFNGTAYRYIIDSYHK